MNCCCHSKEQGEASCCSGKEKRIFSWRAWVSVGMLAVGMVLGHTGAVPLFQGTVVLVWYVLAYLPVGIPVLLEAWEGIRKGEVFNEFTLMSVATVGAFYIGEYPEGVAVMLFYSIGEAFQERAEAWQKRKTAAMSRRDSAKDAIGGQDRPVPDELKNVAETAEKELKSAQARLEDAKGYYKTNASVYDSLKPVMEERGKIMEEHRRLDDLYNLLSGNVTGSRMDIETYVQRCYLERILYAANRRFEEMSAGQFELRMFDIDKAGKGKNRGLDLMVYSTVTGKEREVRTLSGGESFMAALCLALGMADQIQESAASVNLDMMFIDEGFGSLDEHSRDKAVRVLQEMAGGSRLIGIISHVTELKQEIEDQLIVTKDEEGSHVRWQIS